MRTRLCLSLFVLLGCGDPERGAPPSGSGDAAVRDAGPDRDGGDGGPNGPQSCARTACDPKAVCNDEDGTAECTCLDGYEGDGLTCTDIDECEDGGGGCDENAVCINLEGGHRCLCNETFSGDGTTCTDQDECSDPQLNTCDPNAECSDTDDGFTCSCNENFTGDGFGCGDVDECADADLFTCGANATCDNTFGGYRCVCDPLYGGDGKEGCEGLCEIAHDDPAVCHANGVCRIVEQAAACEACAPGHVGDGIDCAVAADCPEPCDGDGTDDIANTICTGSEGARTCACAPGFGGDPNSACTDLDECGSATTCGANSTCIETPGGYFCDCDDGFEWDGTGCVDRNECTETPRPCHPDAQCVNTEGSYSCSCRPGYMGDGAVCRDIDECQEGDDDCREDGTARCVNTAGSYECRCRRGYTGDGVTSCSNLNECGDENLNDCAENATCTDLSPADNPLGYACTCPEGLGGDGTECSDVNECLNAALNECDEHATCINDEGGYTCECRAPYTGDNPQECYCDLSGWWAMRHDFDVCWCDRKASDVTVISGGEFESTAWELHKYSYDGETLVTEKKSCGAEADPDVISPLLRETYGSYIPQEVFFALPLRRGVDVPESRIVPGRNFTTPDEAFVDGIDIGPDPLCENCWPATYNDVHESGSAQYPRWVDTDGDGEVGITLWPRVPSERTQAAAPGCTDEECYYNYLPADLSATNVTSRAGCVSVGTRVITRLHASVVTCERIVGEIVNVKSEARVASCTRVPQADWAEDITCDEEGWSSMERCNSAELMLLDDQDQSLNTSATFELIKIAPPDEEVDCSDVIRELPAIVRRTPTPIDCNCP